jgi:thiol-disulfide isomerase/thioredoxin
MKRIAARVLGILFIAATLLYAAVRYVDHRVATHAYAPHLKLHPQPAPTLAFTTLEGKPQTLASARGKVVIVNLWGTWCLPCLVEMRTFQPLYDHFRNDPQVAFFFLATNDAAPKVTAFATRYHLDLPMYLSTEPNYPITAPSIPTTYILTPDGNIASTITGSADWSDPAVIAFIENLKPR